MMLLTVPVDIIPLLVRHLVHNVLKDLNVHPQQLLQWPVLPVSFMFLSPFCFCCDQFLQPKTGVQWLGGRVLASRQRGRGFEPHQHHCIVSLSKNINPSLVLVQPIKSCALVTERC